MILLLLVIFVGIPVYCAMVALADSARTPMRPEVLKALQEMRK